MGAVKGESFLWTSMSRSFYTCPLRAFIMKSILSFIICISATMCGGATSVAEGLLKALLPFGPSLFRLSVVCQKLSPSCSSSLLRGSASLWCSYSSRSWFCLVRRSTATTKVCTCLSRTAAQVSLSWLLVVAIKHVSTIQLFAQEEPTDNAKNLQ